MNRLRVTIRSLVYAAIACFAVMLTTVAVSNYALARPLQHNTPACTSENTSCFIFDATCPGWVCNDGGCTACTICYVWSCGICPVPPDGGSGIGGIQP